MFPRADPPGLRRVLAACAAVGISLGLGVGVAGCANGAALGLVRQACQHVKLSLALYAAAERETDAKVAAEDRARAVSQLQTASPLAAEAAGEAPQWQALMATLAENSRLPESDLVPALQQQCLVAQTGGNPIPGVPNTTLPAPPGPTAGG
ncbi:MAG TPA: hypothetical protein VN816_01255 [Acidimicrobiales bacterium]|nr:hypothetical protein [Acidimicrobiales bacterium]